MILQRNDVTFLLCTVPGPVSNLRYFSLSSTETRVSWAPPMTPNGVILSYSLTVTDLNGNLVQDSIINVSPTADDISLIVSGLSEFPNRLVACSICQSM